MTRPRPVFIVLVLSAAIPLAVSAGWKRFDRTEPVPAQPVVADAVTGLLWQGCPNGLSGLDCATGEASSLDWFHAIDACNTLAWGGHTDWRVPDVKELDSLIDSQQRSPSIDPLAFPGTPTGWYWTSTTYASDISFAWHANFSSGHIANFDKVFICYVRCVRDAG